MSYKYSQQQSGVVKYVSLLLMVFGALMNLTSQAQTRFEQMPEVELMRDLRGQWIAEQTILNGVPASIRSFEGRADVDEVVAHYQDAWRGGKGSKVRQNKEWTIISTKQKDRFITLHVRPDGRGSQGLIVVSGDPAKYESHSRSEFPLPPDAKVVNRQSFLDSGVRAETITLHSERSAGVERTAIENELVGAGWAMVAGRAGETVKNAHTMEFRKGKQRARVFIANDEKWNNNTMVLITWIQN